MQTYPGATIEWTVTGADTGLVGTIGVRIIDAGTGTTTVARSTASCVELPAGSGVYTFTAITAPSTGGTYTLVADTGGGTPIYAAEELLVSSSATAGSSDSVYFTVAEARAVPPLDNTTKYPDADIEAVRQSVEEALEDACGVSFIQRTATDTLDGNAGTDIVLDRSRVSAVTAASIDGTALTASELADLAVYPDGTIYNPAGWTRGRRNVSITYTHGHATIPGRVKRAAIMLTRRYLVDSPVNDRATSLVNDDGTTQWLVTAGVRGALFDLPEVNAIVQQYRERLGIA